MNMECKNCKSKFNKRRFWQRFCSNNCRSIFYQKQNSCIRSPQAQMWRSQHAKELRMSNQKHFLIKDKKYRESHKFDGRGHMLYKFNIDYQLEYEMKVPVKSPIRSFAMLKLTTPPKT